ncbi:viroplasmin family protein [Paenibacillus barcinonensis]|uniref:Ribonuclease H n=1 Tax=Paenibacillus barcinonensis TaxID=198119 RepID=A0A2V4V6U4_PAEBA|nr:ribonuclease H family protein [Paenibacillus barcinonensis]PYE47539.1 ribonuclease HI [Paenibacillus barcinonensis]QKS56446.1 viroplasmin family protein [Paenibacillus barcinonensis]
MAKQKYYVVWEGKKPGVYSTWAECKAQTDQYAGAKYKSYESREAAEAAYRAGWKGNWGSSAGAAGSASKFKSGSSGRSAGMETSEEVDYDSISVDVGTRGNPGPVEYKGVDTRTGEVLFSVGPISKGTNNLGEFLAIVHALAYLQKQGSNKTVYTDSVNAMKWLKQKKVATTLPRDHSTEEIWLMIDRAEQWLHTHAYTNKVLKWQTKQWGEIKADYGRK